MGRQQSFIKFNDLEVLKDEQMKYKYLDVDTFGKMYGENNWVDYVFQATIGGITRVYVAEVRNSVLENLFLHKGEDPLLVKNRFVQKFEDDEELARIKTLFNEVEDYLYGYHIKIIN